MAPPNDQAFLIDVRDMAFEVERLRVSATSAGAERLALAFELALHEIGAVLGRRGLPFADEHTSGLVSSPDVSAVRAPSR